MGGSTCSHRDGDRGGAGPARPGCDGGNRVSRLPSRSARTPVARRTGRTRRPALHAHRRFRRGAVPGRTPCVVPRVRSSPNRGADRRPAPEAARPGRGRARCSPRGRDGRRARHRPRPHAAGRTSPPGPGNPHTCAADREAKPPATLPRCRRHAGRGCRPHAGRGSRPHARRTPGRAQRSAGAAPGEAPAGAPAASGAG